MIHQKLLKINSRPVKDHRESICLLNLFEADKHYVLTLSETGKFTFEKADSKDKRLCRVANKTLLRKNNIQLNLHDGTNVLAKDKIAVGDSVYIDLIGEIKEHIPMEKGRLVLIISGKYAGKKGKIHSVHGGKITLELPEKEDLVKLNKEQLIVQ